MMLNTTTVVNEEAASAVHANGSGSNTANTLTLAEIEWAMQLPQAHCTSCGQDKAYSAMAMAGLCQTCADEQDEDSEAWYADREDALSLMHW